MNGTNLKSAAELISKQLDQCRNEIVSEVFEGLQRKKEKPEIASLIDVYFEESIFMLSLITPYLLKLPRGLRILEVGGGTGILSHIIHNAGYNITCIEPGANSFGFMPEVQNSIIRALQGGGIKTANIDDQIIENYNAEKFDFIFSSHVLEHVSNKSESFRAMSRLLTPDGLMVHLCPNYLVPYEPHIGIFLVPFIGAANRRVFKSSYRAKKEIWDGINFIDSIQVGKLAKSNNLKVKFKKEIFNIYLSRYLAGSELEGRHSGRLFRILTQIFSMSRIHVIVPGWLQSPMLFELKRVSKG